MDPVDAHPTTSRWYRTWAERDTATASPLYSDWAGGIARDHEVLALIDALPADKRQPNLVLGTARFLGAPEEGYATFRQWLVARWDDVVPVILSRRTQTNEVGRCATLLPVLARLAGPLALLEVGASAGLCLYPDRWSYRYETPAGAVRLDPRDGPSDVVLGCRLAPAEQVPARLPEVVWRAGLDLNPLDVTSTDDVAWLSALVWPGQDHRRERLRSALAVAAQDPPEVVAGDLLTDLRGLAGRAPADARLVVLHSAVLAYLTPEQRASFVAEVRSLDATWVSNEGAAVLPWHGLPDDVGADFVVAVDGRPVALADQHGASWTGLPVT